MLNRVYPVPMNDICKKIREIDESNEDPKYTPYISNKLRKLVKMPKKDNSKQNLLDDLKVVEDNLKKDFESKMDNLNKDFESKMDLLMKEIKSLKT